MREAGLTCCERHGWSWSSRGTDELPYPGWSLGPSVFTHLVYFKLGERWCHPHVTEKKTDAKTDWDPCLRARTLEGAPRTGPGDLPYRQWLWEVQAERKWGKGSQKRECGRSPPKKIKARCLGRIQRL